MKNSKATYQKGCFGKELVYVHNVSEYSREFSVRTIRKCIESLPKGKRILDVGCADGELLKEFTAKHQIFGIDIAPNLLKMAARKGIRTKVCDLEDKVPFGNDFFDILVIHHVLEHVINTDRVLSECNRVLKKGGKLLITFPNTTSPVSLIMFLLDFPSYQAARYRSIHVRDLTLKTVKIALANNGFEIVKNFGGSFLIVKNNFLSFISHTFPRFAGEITILARKVRKVKRSQVKLSIDVRRLFW